MGLKGQACPLERAQVDVSRIPVYPLINRPKLSKRHELIADQYTDAVVREAAKNRHNGRKMLRTTGENRSQKRVFSSEESCVFMRNLSPIRASPYEIFIFFLTQRREKFASRSKEVFSRENVQRLQIYRIKIAKYILTQ